MPIITKIDKRLKSFLKDELRSIQAEVSAKLGPEVRDEILELLQDGISPTAGGKYKPDYSERYIKGITGGKYPGKTISPVNLKLTGKLYESLVFDVRETKTRISTRLRFRQSKRAKEHDEGLNGLPVRRLLPNKGESWHVNIALIVDGVLNNAMRKFVKKYSDKGGV